MEECYVLPGHPRLLSLFFSNSQGLPGQRWHCLQIVGLSYISDQPRKCPTDLSRRQSKGGLVSIEGSSSKMKLACFKLTNKTKTNQHTDFLTFPVFHLPGRGWSTKASKSRWLIHTNAFIHFSPISFISVILFQQTFRGQRGNSIYPNHILSCPHCTSAQWLTNHTALTQAFLFALAQGYSVYE